jgi:hypothetical protein
MEDTIERRYRAYRGVLDKRSELIPWTSKETPPYAMNIIETAVTSMLEDRMKFRVRPRPKFNTPEEMTIAREGAKGHELLLSWQLEQNRFHEKQRTLILQERLAGITCAKLSWRTEIRSVPSLALKPREVLNEAGMIVGQYPMLTPVTEPDVTYDGPDIEVVDMRDFFYDYNAVNWSKNEICTHRVFVTPEEAEQRAASDLPEEVRWRFIDQLPTTRDFAGEWSPRSMLEEQQRHKGRIEVLEIWLREKGRIRVYTIGNRSVLLNERDSPYWHGEFPFVLISTQADLFRIGGISQIEKIEGLQRMLWTISNLRQDAVLLATMPMVLLQEGFDDPDSFEFRPFARNLVTQPKEVNMWSPDAQATQISLPTENTLKADMQTLTGGFPFTDTAEASRVRANSATEASLVNDLAQRALVTAKTFLNYGYERLGQQMMWLNQQYVRDPVYINVLGLSDEYETQVIVPEMLRGAFDFVMEPVADSLLRQEKRSEATALYQMAMQSASMFMMTGQPLNLKPFLEDVLDAYDKKDIERYLFNAQPQGVPGMAGQPGAMGGPGMPGMPGMPAMPGAEPPAPPGQSGVTSPLATNQQSPSNPLSMNPAVAMARQGAMNGPRNV